MLCREPRALLSVTLPILFIDKCFGENKDTFGIYNDSIKSVVGSSLEGINSTVFMYGQTGSGKTYTMLGEYSTEIAEFLKNRKQGRGRKERAKPYTKSRSPSANNVKMGFMASPNIIANIGRQEGINSRNCVTQPSETKGSSNGNSIRDQTPEPKRKTSRITDTTADYDSSEELVDDTHIDFSKSEDGDHGKTEGILILALKDVFKKKEEVIQIL